MKTAVIAILALFSFGSAATAQPILIDSGPVRTSHVRVADLNLTAAAGRATAERRIRGAAAAVCSNDGDRSIEAALAVHHCFGEAIDAGRRQLDSLTTYTVAAELARFGAKAGGS